MKTAIISDVHANLEALSAVFSDIDSVSADRVYFLGDAVGYGANPNEVVELIDQRCNLKLMGNHDYSALGKLAIEDFNPFAQVAINFTSSILTEKSLRALAAYELTASDDEALYVHATPRQPEAWNYCISTSDAALQFEHFTQDLCFLGHSHKPAVFYRSKSGQVKAVATEGALELRDDCRHIINVGSVGQPRDGDPRSSYAVFDSDDRTIEFRRVDYDVSSAQEKMAAAQLPSFLVERLASGK